MTDEEKKQRQVEKNKRYHQEHREEILARKRANYQLNKSKPKKEKTPEQKEALRKYQREYKAKDRQTEEGKIRQRENDKRYAQRNKDKISAKRRELYAANKEAIKAKNREYYQENAEKLKADKREYCKNNRDRVRIVEKAIEHKRRSARGNLSSKNIQLLLTEWDECCPYCQNKVNIELAHIEHCIPLSRGGTNDLENVVIACETCNKKKNSKTPLEFIFNWPKVTDRYDFFVRE